MVRRLGLLVFAACSSKSPPVFVSSAGDAPSGKPETVLRPLAMKGPFPTLLASCMHAPVCGGTDIDPKTDSIINPPSEPDCSAFEPHGIDPNGTDPDGKPVKLDHETPFGELRIGGVACWQPEGLHGSEAIYYAFVHRTDGWWRSAPLFTFSYNDKYCGGSMIVRWNDQNGRTFAGVAGTVSCSACNKDGTEDETLEMMVRFEPSTASPIVFPLLVVGESTIVKPDEDGSPADCKPSREAVSMRETWPSDDVLVLSGPATWNAIGSSNGVLSINVGAANQASSAGRYHFTR